MYELERSIVYMYTEIVTIKQQQAYLYVYSESELLIIREVPFMISLLVRESVIKFDTRLRTSF